jgi:hypothetical protein
MKLPPPPSRSNTCQGLKLKFFFQYLTMDCKIYFIIHDLTGIPGFKVLVSQMRIKYPTSGYWLTTINFGTSEPWNLSCIKWCNIQSGYNSFTIWCPKPNFSILWISGYCEFQTLIHTQNFHLQKPSIFFISAWTSEKSLQSDFNNIDVW